MAGHSKVPNEPARRLRDPTVNTISNSARSAPPLTAHPGISISLLNHASILVEDGTGIRLLSDPWYDGYAFEEGWGLRYLNERAFEQAQQATHLWISHFHDDHMHMPTLKELFRRNPGIVFLANASYNFNIAAVARRIGFAQVIELAERQELRLSDAFSVIRYPATGIDNMLLMDAAGIRILNYNDCNLSSFAQRRLMRRMGRIDVLLSNFNHAGKLLHTRKVADEVVKRKLIDNFRGNYQHFSPAVVIPFASHHYYRAPESAEQNSSMITPSELLALDSRIVDLEVGDTLRLGGEAASPLVRRGSRSNAPLTLIERKLRRTPEELLEAGKAYSKKLRAGYGMTTHLLPGLVIEVVDLGIVTRFSPAAGLAVLDSAKAPVAQVQCHSAALHSWFTRTYGTDAFAVGAHFRLGTGSRLRLVLLIAAGMLVENKLDLKSLLRALFRPEGRRFIFNRREEIMGIFFSGKIFADYHKE